MHGPGGESYYAAIWANDQAEYASPFFPFWAISMEMNQQLTVSDFLPSI
jgi:hypothetical protein